MSSEIKTVEIFFSKLLAKGGLAQRLRDHLSGSSSFKYHYLNGDGSILRNNYQFRCVEVENPRIRTLLEAYAIGHLCPQHLGLGQTAFKGLVRYV